MFTMSQFSQKQNELKCTEILTFPETKLRIIEDSIETSSYNGILRVLYFYDLDRFLLYHNDWNYALLKRLPVTALSGNTLKSRSYAFPSNNGSFILDLQQVTAIEDLYTLETILKNNSQFYFQELEQSLESSDEQQDLNTNEDVHATGGRQFSSNETETYLPIRKRANENKENLGEGVLGLVRKFSNKFLMKRTSNVILEAEIGHERLKDLSLGVAEIMYVNKMEVEMAIIKSNNIARGLYGVKKIEKDFDSDACVKIDIGAENEDEKIFQEEMRIVELMDRRHLTAAETKEMESRERKLQRMIEKRDTKILKLVQEHEAENPFSPGKGDISLNTSETKENKPLKMRKRFLGKSHTAFISNYHTETKETSKEAEETNNLLKLSKAQTELKYLNNTNISMQDWLSKFKKTEYQPIEIIIEEEPKLEKLKSEKKLSIKPAPAFQPPSNIWIRSILPDFVSCHHVWWLLHFITTGLLLWAYFTERISITAGTLSVIELLVGVAVRNEIFLTILHHIIALIPFGRYFFNRMLHCIGGIHTSSAFNAMMWLLISLVNENHHVSVLVTGYILVALIVILIISALPPVRRKYHNSFEYFHRFVGWTALGVLIAHVALLQVDAIDKPTVAQAFENVPTIMTIIITFIIFLPWMLVRKTKVSFSQPSGNLTVATFNGTYNPYGTVSRISFNGLEWHAFAIALVDAKKNQYSLVIAKAGDWTTSLSEGCAKGTLPNKMWVRKMKSIGFMYSIHAYRRVLIVYTGSGIAPALPYIKNPIPTTSAHVLWIAKKHRQIFGDFLMDLVEKTAPNYTLHDTSIDGRPSPALAEEWYYKVGAEAVFIVSNESFTDECVNTMWKHGIPAFGALFDS